MPYTSSYLTVVYAYTILYIINRVVIVHQLQYTYKIKDYSFKSWIDSLITAAIMFLLKNIFSIIYYPLNKNVINFGAIAGQYIGIWPAYILLLFSFIAITIFLEGSVCKFRYPSLPWKRIVVFITILKIINLLLVIYHEGQLPPIIH